MFVKASGPGPVLVPAESDDLLQDVRMSVHAKWVSGLSLTASASSAGTRAHATTTCWAC